MIFNNHSNLEGQHAFLGASKYHWINYDETKVDGLGQLGANHTVPVAKNKLDKHINKQAHGQEV